MKQKLSSPSFADLFLGQRNVKQTFFLQINTVIDWTPIRAMRPLQNLHPLNFLPYTFRRMNIFDQKMPLEVTF